MESKHRKRVKVRVKQRIRLKPKSTKQRRRNKAIFFCLWSSALVIFSALYLTNFATQGKFTIASGQLGRKARRKQALQVRDAILEIETLLQVIENKIEKEQSLSRDLNTLIAQKGIIEKSEFMNSSPRVKGFVELLDSIETLKKENDTDTKALLIKVKQIDAYLKRNRGDSRSGE